MLEYVMTVLNNITLALSSDPIYLVIAIILSALILYSLVKKLVKLMLYLLAIFIIYLGYLYFTGQDYPTNVNDIIEQGAEIIEQGAEVIEEQIDKVVKEQKGK
tara:strand:+ start:184 stop:492 length:309 start_codon:yes stop_codon:yes gene_type:complete